MYINYCLSLCNVHAHIQKSLKFPDGVEMSAELRDLVSRLLTDPASRMGFSDLQTHSFFSSTDWENLLQSMLALYQMIVHMYTY